MAASTVKKKITQLPLFIVAKNLPYDDNGEVYGLELKRAMEEIIGIPRPCNDGGQPEVVFGAVGDDVTAELCVIANPTPVLSGIKFAREKKLSTGSYGEKAKLNDRLEAIDFVSTTTSRGLLKVNFTIQEEDFNYRYQVLVDNAFDTSVPPVYLPFFIQPRVKDASPPAVGTVVVAVVVVLLLIIIFVVVAAVVCVRGVRRRGDDAAVVIDNSELYESSKTITVKARGQTPNRAEEDANRVVIDNSELYESSKTLTGQMKKDTNEQKKKHADEKKKRKKGTDDKKKKDTVGQKKEAEKNLVYVEVDIVPAASKGLEVRFRPTDEAKTAYVSVDFGGAQGQEDS